MLNLPLHLVIKTVFPRAICNIETNEPALFLTFDDGPIPEVTPSVLEVLKLYNAKATFFCIGENVAKYPDVFRKILSEGHSIGNHTYNHLNGWKTQSKAYIQNAFQCTDALNLNQNTDPIKLTRLFRPPKGKMTLSQYSKLKQQYSIIFWDVLTNDWKQSLSGNDCFQIVKKRARPGSIIVFHDSLKAETRMKPALKMTLDYFSNKGYVFKSLDRTLL